MMGKTHLKLGVLYYVILSATVLPIITVFPLLYRNSNGISITGIIVAAFAAMLPDLDSQHSIINKINPANKIIDFITQIIELIIRLLFTIGIAILIIKYAELIITQIEQIKYLKKYAEVITYGTASLLIVMGIMGENMIISIPILGDGYKRFINFVRKGNAFFKRFVCAAVGVLIMAYNYKHGNDVTIYITGALLIAAVIFPHRTFLHSIEGFLLFTYCMCHFFNTFGFSYLGGAFFLGYASHLYMADIFTKEGVPLSIIPKLLQITHIYEKIKNIKGLDSIYKILNIRLRIPLSSTGTSLGNKIEAAYVLILLLIVATIVLKHGIEIRVL